MRVLVRIAETRSALDAARADRRSVGFVPTMGFLHEGHASLIRRARAENETVLVSIFVNPLQFGANEDLAAYPRDLERDLALCEATGVDIVFHPDTEEMYGSRAPLTISVGALASKLCGRARPGHFDGVATVVAKLFNIAGSCRAYFGEKDAQQLVVLRTLARALDFPVTVIGCPIVREPDGLAMSSRNVYLTPGERAASVVLARTLAETASAIEKGERDGRRIANAMAERISSEPLARLDYAECIEVDTLEDVMQIEGTVLLAVAAWFGKARLIDNSTVNARQQVTVTANAASIEGST